MKNDYKIFNNPEFGDIRVLNIEGKHGSLQKMFVMFFRL